MEISFNELLDITNPNIIDIRSRQKYSDNHIPGAVNIEYSILINDPSRYLNKNNIYYFYCQKGLTSKTLSQILNALGYKTYNIIGGYETYLLKNIKL
ncbi:MAG: rhodanese-like domain-containing protein [Bacilli bacterium]|nr:rhodanese-like domain-containing protein [Bacilli bacterium]